jgi:hypothetical protein
MTTEEAKLILCACRPSGQDAADPQVREALALAERDPALAEWWERERAFDRAVGGAVRACPVSRGLKAAILAGQTVARPNFRANRAWWIAVAAAVVLMAAAGSLTLRQPKPVARVSPGTAPAAKDFEVFRADMLAFLDRLNRLDYVSKDFAEVKGWLEGKSAADLSRLPDLVSQSVPIGCRITDWNGHKVTLVCFNSQSGGSRYKFHLLIAEKDGPQKLSLAERVIATREGWNTAGWEDDRYVYLLATASMEDVMRRLMPPTG